MQKIVYSTILCLSLSACGFSQQASDDNYLETAKEKMLATVAYFEEKKAALGKKIHAVADNTSYLEYQEMDEKKKIIPKTILPTQGLTKYARHKKQRQLELAFNKEKSKRAKSYSAKKELVSTESTFANLGHKYATGTLALKNWYWPTQGEISRYFSGEHKGLDLTGIEKQPIYAMQSGVVVYSGSSLRGYGNMVIVKHAKDYLSAYAHNSENLVVEGEKVQIGQKIALMGNTGANMTKLHLQVRKNGKPIDPTSLF